MAITAEKLSVDVDADTSKAEEKLTGFGDKAKGSFGFLGLLTGAVAGFAGAAAVGFGGTALTAAGDYQETISKTGTVFGDATQQVVDNANRQAEAYGTPRTAILDAAASFGLLGSAAGLAEGESAAMSNQLANLAADATSFYNVPLDEALAAINSGLVGEAEPMRRFGVLLNEAAVEAEAMRLGISDGTTELTEAQKVQARSSLIMAGMSKASGDLERTQGSFSNRLREVKNRVMNWATATAQSAIPAATRFLEVILEAPAALAAVTGFLSEHQTAIAVTAGVITAVFLPAMIRAGTVAVVSGAQQVAAFVAARVAAVVSAAAQWAAMVRVVAGWVMAGAAAVRSGAQTVAIWAMYQAAAIRGAAASVAAHGRIVVGWVASGVAAAAGAARMVAAWVLAGAAAVAQGAVIAGTMAVTAARVVAGWVVMGAQATAQAARIVAGWVLAGAGAIAQGAVMVASMAVTAASVVAGWVLMAAQAMAQAARMAAAWFIALGPIGWVIAAVIGLVALIIANWDTVSRVTAQVWQAIVGWVRGAWQAITQWVASAVEGVKSTIQRGFALVVTIVTMYVNIWRAVISAVWNAIQAVVRSAIAGVQAAISGLASIAGRVGAWFGAVRDAIADRLSDAVNFVRGIPGKIVDALSSAAGMMRNAGAAIMGGLVEGIRAQIGRVTGAVENVMQAARDLLPFSPAKRGPFSGKGWSRYSGESIARDLAAGMDRNVNLVKRAGLNMATAAAQSIPSAGGARSTARSLGTTGPAAVGAPVNGHGPTTLVIVDANRELIGRMRVESGKVATGQVTPLDEGLPRW